MKAVRKLEKLHDESTGICPLGDCRKPAYPHGVYGFEGYVDACAEHATIVWDDEQKARAYREDGCAFDSDDGRYY